MDEGHYGIAVREMVVKFGDGRPRIPALTARYQIHWAGSQWYAVSFRTTCPIAGNGK
jgi:hypothetical protein